MSPLIGEQRWTYVQIAMNARIARQKRKVVTGAQLLVVLCGLGLTVSSADAAVYWANSRSIGRANVDGSEFSQNFVGNYQYPDIRSGCGLAVDGSHVYWADRARGWIGRANIDGSEPDFDFIGGAEEPCSVAVDDSYIYWANQKPAGSIGRATREGTEVNQEFIGAITRPCGIAVNEDFIYWASASLHSYIGRALLVGGTKGPPIFEGDGDFDLCGVAVDQQHIYWGGYGHVIGRAKLNGSDLTPTFITGVERPCAVAVDDSHIYWTEEKRDGTIGRASLDGTSVASNFIPTGEGYPCGVAVDSLRVSLKPFPVLPPPRATCSIIDVGYDKRRAFAVVGIDADIHGKLRVKTLGLGWRVLGKEGPPWIQGTKRWQIKVWPGRSGRVAKRIRRSLARRGWSRLKLAISCDPTDDSYVPVTTKRQITLRRSS